MSSVSNSSISSRSFERVVQASATLAVSQSPDSPTEAVDLTVNIAQDLTAKLQSKGMIPGRRSRRTPPDPDLTQVDDSTLADPTESEQDEVPF